MKNLWERLSKLPAGKSVFSRALGMKIPYTGSIKPEVLEFHEGHAKVKLRDRRAVRNHLQSIHAVALMNVCELTSGLAVTSAIPKDCRIILRSFHIDYLKKSRGTIVAEAKCEPSECPTDQDFTIEVVARDEAGDVVASAKALWRGGPAKKTSRT